MGLNMYGASYQGNRNEVTPENFYYWRKHHQLNDWMVQLCIAKTGVTEREIEEACIFEVELTAADLEKLETEIHAGKIKDVDEEGDHIPPHDTDFITEARRRLLQGLNIIYHADW